MTARIVVLASGNGTNCQALIEACGQAAIDAEIAAVISNNPDAYVIERAALADIPAVIVEHRASEPERRSFEDERLIETIEGFEPDLVVLAGWMRILGATTTQRFPIVNLHPALPGELAGVNAIDRAFAEWQAGQRRSTGVMVHWVPDAGVDTGPAIVSETVDFLASDTADSFEKRMHLVEHRLIVEGVKEALNTVIGA